MGELAAIFCALTWAAAVILFRRSGASLSPLSLNLFKNSLALILFALTTLAASVDARWPLGALWPEGASGAHVVALLVSGALGLGLADTLFLAALNRLGAGRTAVIECLYSPFVALFALAHPGLDESLHPSFFVGLGLIIAGVLLANRRSATEPKAPPEKELGLGVLLGVISIAAMAVGIVIAKPALNDCPVLWSNVLRLLGGMIFIIPMAVLRKDRAEVFAVFRASAAWRSAVPAAFVGTYFGMIFWLAASKYADVTIASALSQTSAFFTLVFAARFLDEALTPSRFFAVALGFAGALSVLYPQLIAGP